MKLQLSFQRNYKIFTLKVYLEPIQTSKIELFVKIVNSLMPLTILTKSSILDVWLGSKNATKSFNKSFCEFNIFSFSSHLVKYFFFLLLCELLFLTIFKSDLKLILIQTNIYVKTYTSMQISRCRQDKTIVSDNFKRNLRHSNIKKVEHVQLFHIKMKED